MESIHSSLDRSRTRKKSQVAARIILVSNGKERQKLTIEPAVKFLFQTNSSFCSCEQKTREQILPDTDLIIYCQKMVIGQQRKGGRKAVLLKSASVGNQNKLTKYVPSSII